jgi:hypothetical protein
VLAPPAATGAALPALPPALAGRAPAAGAAINRALVTVVEADYVADYRALRQHHGPLLLATPFGRDDVSLRYSTGVWPAE